MSEAIFTREQVQQLSVDPFTRCLLIINDCVYDVTSYLDQHPGGSSLLIEFAGRDATEDFFGVGHSASARMKLEAFKIGVLAK